MKNKKIIIGLTGQIACGKGAITKYLEKKYGASSYRFSTMLRDVLDRIYIEQSRANLSLISKIIRKNFGEDTMAKVMTSDVKNDKNKIIVVDGIRRLADIKYLKKIPGFKLVRVVVDSKIRYERLLSRNENKGDNKKTYQDLLRDEKKEADAQIPQVMKKAEIEINNEGNIKELYKQIENKILLK